MTTPPLSRRSFVMRSLAGASAALTLPGLAPAEGLGAEPRPSRPVPLIHQTDLFRPYADPDDHFDLACVYALARLGAVNLLGILCDSPPPKRDGDPDTASVAMLNHITGLAAPLAVGMPQQPASRHDRMEKAPTNALAGVNWLLKTLRESPDPVVITVVGSCKDVALAARREPKLFARKCRAIYLNAGTGTPKPLPDDQLEYNVELDPGSYASMFDVPCPLYWLPCFEQLRPGQAELPDRMQHGTYYKFMMGEVLPHLSAPMQRYFLSMLDCEPATLWLKSLRQPVDAGKLASYGKIPRNMWCTAGFLHLAGMTLSASGSLCFGSAAQTDPAYRFVPIQVECDDQGRTRWQPGRAQPARCKFEAPDIAGYPKAMTAALKALLCSVPDPAARG